MVREIDSRLQFLVEVGLNYLSLNRESGTLSGGEAQRIRLATQIGSGLAGVLYVLDEPSIGLHQRDNARLLATLRRLRDLGNSVIVVEHDEETIRAADHILDLGPGAGPRGGEIVAQGTIAEVLRAKNSPTADYLSGRAESPSRSAPAVTPRDAQAGPEASGWLTITGAAENNLKDVTASFPIGCFTCVTGVSGSGKSTLVDDILRRALFRHFYNSKDKPGTHRALRGLDQLDKAIVIDQSAIGRTPRSNPITYTGAFTPIRELFSQLPARACADTTRALQLQCQRRALRELRRRRADQDRDAFSAGCLCGMRSLPRTALQPRNARDHFQGKEYRRCART